jgi:hypothetical protein
LKVYDVKTPRGTEPSWFRSITGLPLFQMLWIKRHRESPFASKIRTWLHKASLFGWLYAIGYF